MKRLLSLAVTLCAVFLAAGANAGEEKKKIYRSKDAQGNTVFSDRADPDSAEIELQEPITLPSDALADEYEVVFGDEDDEANAQGSNGYRSLSITAPPDNEPIRANDGNIRIEYRVEPSAAPSHRIELLMDGKVIRDVTGSGSMALQNVDRGTHQAQLRVTDRETGEVVQRGPVQTFTVMRHSILH